MDKAAREFNQQSERIAARLRQTRGANVVAVDSITYHEDGTIYTATVRIDGGAPEKIVVNQPT